MGAPTSFLMLGRFLVSLRPRGKLLQRADVQSVKSGTSWSLGTFDTRRNIAWVPPYCKQGNEELVWSDLGVFIPKLCLAIMGCGG